MQPSRSNEVMWGILKAAAILAAVYYGYQNLAVTAVIGGAVVVLLVIQGIIGGIKNEIADWRVRRAERCPKCGKLTGNTIRPAYGDVDIICAACFRRLNEAIEQDALINDPGSPLAQGVLKQRAAAEEQRLALEVCFGVQF